MRGEWTDVVVVVLLLFYQTNAQSKSQHNYHQINPKPCRVNELEGRCMFVWECINTGGSHIGMCVDAFMFGSCCSHNLTQSEISRIPTSGDGPTVLFTSPLHGSQHQQSHKRPPSLSRPSDHPTTRPPFVTKPNPSSHHYDKWTKPSSTSELPTDGVEGNQIDVTWWPTGGGGFVTRPGIGGSGGSLRPTGRPTKLRPAPPPPTPSTLNLISPPSSSSFPSHPSSRPTPSPSVAVSTFSFPSHHSTSTTSFHSPVVTSSTPTIITSSTSSTTTSTTTTTAMPPLPSSTNRPVPTPNGLASSAECGSAPLHPRPEVRIVGGRNAQFGVWPWQVSVRRTSFFGFSSTHRCGGALINDKWIATAGHCVDDLLTSQIRIRVGEYDFSSVQEPFPYAERGVAKKVVHPKYNFFTYEYDLALVKLDSPLEFAPHIAPICLPGSDDLLIGENATVTGWGRLSDGGTLPSVLQEVTVPILSNERCKNMFLRAGRHEFFPEIFMCAGFDDGGRDACQGDSGGPLQVRGKDGRYFLAGIISWGIGCAEVNLPGVCTRISKFVPWILQVVT